MGGASPWAVRAYGPHPPARPRLRCSLRSGRGGPGRASSAAADALANDPVYVDPDAERALTGRRGRPRCGRGSGSAAPGRCTSPCCPRPPAGGRRLGEGVARAIAQRLGAPGHLRGRGGRLVLAPAARSCAARAPRPTAALDAHRSEGIAAVLLDFVDRVAELRAGGTGRIRLGRRRRRRDRRALLLPLLALGGGAFLLSRRRRRNASEARAGRAARERARRPRRARRRHPRARPRRRDAGRRPAAPRRLRPRRSPPTTARTTLVEQARAPEDFEPVGAALEEGRYAMTAAKERLAGREPPERTPPCFFDPRHGPSSREVEWAPYGGAPRMVPACEADAQRVERARTPRRARCSSAAGGCRTGTPARSTPPSRAACSAASAAACCPG